MSTTKALLTKKEENYLSMCLLYMENAESFFFLILNLRAPHFLVFKHLYGTYILKRDCISIFQI